MKENTISIIVNKPIEEVFDFTTEPENTHKWIDSIVREELVTNRPIKTGTKYKNSDKEGKWSEYEVTAYTFPVLFEMIAQDKNYHVRYSYAALAPDRTELEYYEWVDKGELENPFTQSTLEKLKVELEK